MTNYDKLSIEIETDGTTTAQAALSEAADILVREFGRFAEVGRPAIAAGDDAPIDARARTCSTRRSRSSTSRCGRTTA